MANRPSEAFGRVFESFMHGKIRLLGAESASLRLALARVAYSKAGNPAPMGPHSGIFEHLSKVTAETLSSYSYIRDVSHLVYATSLLDTYLSDTTMFLLLLHPRAIGSDFRLPIDALLEAKTKNEAVSAAAQRKTRELSFLTFAKRIEFLEKTFGLKLQLADEVKKSLDHFSSLRNVAVHDQGVFELFLDKRGRIASRQKTCRVHPTNLKGDETDKAMEAYTAVVRAVTKSVAIQILKLKSTSKWGKRFLKDV